MTFVLTQQQGGQLETLEEELKKLERDLTLREERIKLLERRISELEAELKVKEERIKNLTRFLTSLKGAIDEVEFLTLLSLDDTSIARIVNASTSYGHNYIVELREVKGRTFMSLIVDGRLLVGRPTNGKVEPEIIYSKALPSTLSVRLRGDKGSYRLGMKLLLIWIKGTETKKEIKIRVRIAAIPKELHEELRRAGWPPLRELFERAVIIYDKGFKVPPS